MAEQNEKLGALWVKSGPKGDYFTGEVNGVKVIVFPNGFKDAENKPDWIVYKSRPKA